MTIKEIVTEVRAKYPEINNVYFVGCGASQSDLYTAKYFLVRNAKRLRTDLITANEFNFDPPSDLGDKSIVITCSLGGTTPETVVASKMAREKGSPVICLTNAPESPLAQNADYPIIHGFHESYSAKMQKLTKCLQLAAEILEQYEGYEDYEDMMKGVEKIYGVIDAAIPYAKPLAEKFARENKDERVIYVMGSGPSQQVAYTFSSFILMEMQWVDSASFIAGEFFHGPFELVEKGKPFMLLMNDGNTRPMDVRALEFLNRFDAKTTVVDAKDYGLGNEIPASVKDYFNPILLDGVLRVYGEAIAEARKHPLTQRRYMWKLNY